MESDIPFEVHIPVPVPVPVPDDDLIAEVERLRAELAAMRKQRDEARREWCYMESCRRCEYAIEPSDERSIAAERGWDCFAQKEGGGA